MRAWYRSLCAINYPTVLMGFWLAAVLVMAMAGIVLKMGYYPIGTALVLFALILLSLPDAAGPPFDTDQ